MTYLRQPQTLAQVYYDSVRHGDIKIVHQYFVDQIPGGRRAIHYKIMPDGESTRHPNYQPCDYFHEAVQLLNFEAYRLKWLRLVEDIHGVAAHVAERPEVAIC